MKTISLSVIIKKNEKTNLYSKELHAFKELAKVLLSLTNEKLNIAIKKREFCRGEIMRNIIAESITSTVKDLNRSGVIDEITMKNIQSLCLPEVIEYTPQKIVSIRKKLKLSQAALASIFNISTSTVQKWEQGNKRPTGASKKLLDIVERKGLEALI